MSSGHRAGELKDEFNLMVRDLRASNQTLLQKSQELKVLNQENTRLFTKVNSKSSRLEQLLHHAITAHETERKRLARELRDETGQSLTSIPLRLKALQSETDIEVIHDRSVLGSRESDFYLILHQCLSYKRCLKSAPGFPSA
jgi:signal transduction histidine kinase